MVTSPFGGIAMVVIVDLSIRKLFVMLLMVCIAIFFVSGCSKKDDGGGSPTGGGSSSDGSLSEHTGANTVVTESNVDQVTTEINNVALSVFGRAMQTAFYGKAVTNETINLRGDVIGIQSGKAAVSGKIINKMDFTAYVGTDYDFTCTFFDFSDDGELYFGGSLLYKGSAKYSKTTLESRTIIIKGGMKFNGKYSGTEDFTTTVTAIISTGKTTYNGATTVTSGGKAFTHSFKY